MEILGRCVVRTRRANDIEPLESQLGLKLAQHIDLTGDTDQSQSAKTSACAYWNKASKRVHRIRVPHALHLSSFNDEAGLRFPTIIRIRRHRDYRAIFQQFGPAARGDTHPLCAIHGFGNSHSMHPLDQTEKQLPSGSVRLPFPENEVGRTCKSCCMQMDRPCATHQNLCTDCTARGHLTLSKLLRNQPLFEAVTGIKQNAVHHGWLGPDFDSRDIFE